MRCVRTDGAAWRTAAAEMLNFNASAFTPDAIQPIDDDLAFYLPSLGEWEGLSAAALSRSPSACSNP